MERKKNLNSKPAPPSSKSNQNQKSSKNLHPQSNANNQKNSLVSFNADAPKPLSKEEFISLLAKRHSSQTLSQIGSEQLWVVWKPKKCSWKPFVLGDASFDHPASYRVFMLGIYDALSDGTRGAFDAESFLQNLVEKGSSFLINLFEKVTTFEKESCFKQCFVPLVYVLTHSALLASPNHRAVGQIFSSFFQSFIPFLTKYLFFLRKLVDSKALFTENYLDGFYPVTISQHVLPFLHLIKLMCSRFTVVTNFSHMKDYPKLLDNIHAILSLWIKRFSEKLLYPSDYAHVESQYSIECSAKIYNEIRVMFDNEKLSVTFEEFLDKRKLMPASDKIKWVNCPIPPGTFDGVSNEKRHDNDHFNIRDISIIPTVSEILHSKANPSLPGNFPLDPNSHWLPPGPMRHLDTNFRLLREDLLSTIRDGVQAFVMSLSKMGSVATSRFKCRSADNENRIDLNIYAGAVFKSVEFTNRVGLTIVVQFNALLLYPNKPQKERTEFWKLSKRLQFGSLICFLCKNHDGDFTPIFSTIVDRNPEKLSLELSEITLLFPSTDIPFIEFTKNNKNNSFYLIELPKLMFESYRPVLEALKSIDSNSVPFSSYLCPSVLPAENLLVNPPFYSLTPEFHFDLTFLVKATYNAPLLFEMNSDYSFQNCMQILQKHSSLDEGQRFCLLKALSSEISFIQGPPGTGKSYIGIQIVRAILESTQNIGPILVVCYTNHALDQFLRELHNNGIDEIVRMGSRSNDETIAKFQVENFLSRETVSRHRLFELYSSLDDLDDERKEILDVNSGNTENLLSWLMDYDFEKFEELDSVHQYQLENKLQIAGKKKKSKTILEQWLSIKKVDGAPVTGIWSLPIYERHALYETWTIAMQKENAKKLKHVCSRMQSIVNEIQGLYDVAKVNLLKRKKVIGCTTTGAAKFINLMQRVKPAILICEEAGEILEAQMLACLVPSISHFVSIGDHQQLRPHISSYNLSCESKTGSRYSLDISMFERMQMSMYKMPQLLLHEQRRMRPLISNLIRKTLYPNLVDHDAVNSYPNVLGMCQNLYFFDHGHLENELVELGHDVVIADNLNKYSHTNSFEVSMIVAFVHYLLKQGYSDKSITVLTPYVSQLFRLREALSKQMTVCVEEKDQEELDDMEDVDAAIIAKVSEKTVVQSKSLKQRIRIATIDNFQGEESDVILISLVRNFGSNPRVTGLKSTIGFLKTANRINVLLSRAKHGMYLFGNASLLSSKSEMWNQVIDILASENLVGPALLIRCLKHENDVRKVSCPEDFASLAPNGGCVLPCPVKLPNCGHICPWLCHSNFLNHQGIFCPQKCVKSHDDCLHLCPKLCGEECGNCLVNVGKVMLPCNHENLNTKCYESKNLPNISCKVKVNKTIPWCKHENFILCGIDESEYVCQKLCRGTLKCGHECNSRCGDCVYISKKQGISFDVDVPIEKITHGKCKVICNRKLLCGHYCPLQCHSEQEECPPCIQLCSFITCDHGICSHSCDITCESCPLECLWNCEHVGKCDLPCGVPCSRLPCDKRCSKLLLCGHQCPSLCGEKCPDNKYCQTCASNVILDTVVDLISLELYRNVNLDTSPVIFLECGHFKTAETLDGQLELSKYYSRNATDDGWDDEKGDVVLPSGFVNVPSCSDCRREIKNIKRYGRIIKRAFMDRAEIVFCEKARNLIDTCSKMVTSMELVETTNTFEKSCDIFSLGAKHYDKIKKFLNESLRFVKRSPQRKIFDLQLSNSIDANVRIPFPPPSRYVATIELLSSEFYFKIAKCFDGILQSFPSATSQLNLNTLNDYYSDSLNYSTMAAEKFLISSTSYVEALFFQIKVDFSKNCFLYRHQKKKFKGRLVLKNDRWKNIFGILLKQLEQINDQKFLQKNGSLYSVLKTDLLKCFQNPSVILHMEDIELLEVYNVIAKEVGGYAGSARGHFYRCPNGHYYVIGECGQANQTSTCPECGATVGGASHNLIQGNSRATDFEERMERLRIR